jgi:hypothetical protein
VGPAGLRGADVLRPRFPALRVPGARLPVRKKPGYLYGDRQEQKFWQGVRQSPARTAREVRAQFRDIDRRLAEVESFYVSSNPRLSAEIEKLR